MKSSLIPFITTLRNFLPLKEHFIRYRWPLVIGLVCLLSVDFLQLLIPLVIKKVIDLLTVRTATPSTLVYYGVVILMIAVSMAALRYFWRLLIIGHSRKLEESLRNRLFNHLQELSLSFYNRTKTGDIMARSINDINAVRMATGMGLVSLVDGVVLGTAAIFFMIYINPLLTLISLLPAPIVIYMARLFTKRMSTGYEIIQKTFSDLTERVREAFAGIRVVKSFSREAWEYNKIKSVGEEYVSKNLKLARTIALFFPMMTLFTNLGLVIVIWLGGRLTITGNISTGDLVAFIGYLNLLTWPMMAMGWVTNIFQRGSASMRRINYILEEIPEIIGPEIHRTAEHPKGAIEFRNVDFKYPEKEKYALKGVSFRIERGQSITIVGRVGSGKTTLLNMIPRMLESETGSILIDGMDIHDFPLKILREGMGFVTQDTILFSDTIRSNVVLGRNAISEELLVESLKIAQIYDEVQPLSKGLDTLLGEKGMTLSGGQRQRLTIARAIVADPALLILDDALSMVDTRTEAAILGMILSRRKNRTNLIISHRLSTIAKSDLVIVLNNGEIVEIGDHKTLLRNNGEFSRLYERQRIADDLDI